MYKYGTKMKTEVKVHIDIIHPYNYLQSVDTAWNYNVGNGGGDSSFEAATNSYITINVIETDGRSVHDNGNVYWNPDLGTGSNKKTAGL